MLIIVSTTSNFIQFSWKYLIIMKMFNYTRYNYDLLHIINIPFDITHTTINLVSNPIILSSHNIITSVLHKDILFVIKLGVLSHYIIVSTTKN